MERRAKSRYRRARSVGESSATIPELKVFAVEPAESPFFSGGKPGPHKIQGIGAGFKPEIFNREIVDRIVTVTYEQARAATQRLAELEGILCGVSSGAILHASTLLAQLHLYL